MVLGQIFGAAITAIVCGGIVFAVGSGQGKTLLGVIGAILAFGFAAYSWFGYSIPFAIALSILISLVPTFNRPLLSHSEVEEEMRRARTM
jgi:hypothetical protein